MAQNKANKAAVGAVRSRWWLFTLWADKITLDAIKSKLDKYDAYAGQMEKCPTTDRLHYQFVLYHRNAISNEQLDKLFKGAGSYIKGDGKVAMVKYCDKQQTAYPEDDPIKFKRGVFPFEKENTAAAANSSTSFKELHSLVVGGASVDELLLVKPEAAWHSKRLREVEAALLKKKGKLASDRVVRVEYHWGVSGSGKTLGARAKCGDENIYLISDYKHAFDNYDGQPVLVLDEYHHQFDFEFLKKGVSILLPRFPVVLSEKSALTCDIIA